MRHLNLFAILALLGLVACQMEDIISSQSIDNLPNCTEYENMRDEKAINNLNSILNDIQNDTRALTTHTIKSQLLIKVSDFVEDIFKEDLSGYDNEFYLVVFENPDGSVSTAVLGATPNLPSTIAIMNGIELTLEDCRNAWIKIATQEDLLYDETSVQTRSQPGYESDLLLDSTIPIISLITSTPNIEITPPSNITSDEITVEEYWETVSLVRPLVKSHFNQQAPFNNLYDYMNGVDGDKYYAGCGVVALAQIITYNKLERGYGPNVIGNYIIDWETIRSAVEKQNKAYQERYGYIGFYVSYTEAEKQELAKLHRALADKVVKNGGYKPSGTTTDMSDIADFLSNNKYNDVKKHRGYKEEIVYTMLVERMRPICCRGACVDCDGAHIFVIDGWYHRHLMQKKTRTIKYKDGRIYTSTTIDQIKTEKLIHVNWGYEGDRDGYFNQAVFDSHNAVCVQEESTRSSADCESDNYSDGIYLISYSGVK
ncbi:MAG: C10 family peptidase [Alistipes sp.]|nr:C10 family peptidase [Alistipes sp.]